MVICKLPILLAERKMRVADLIRGTGINKTTLHKLYNGELTRIDLETIDRICDYLDVQVGDLFVFEKDNKEQPVSEQFGHKWSHQKVKWSQIIERLVKKYCTLKRVWCFLQPKKALRGLKSSDEMRAFDIN